MLKMLGTTIQNVGSQDLHPCTILEYFFVHE